MAKTDSPETIVSQGMHIEGELKSHGDIRIDGTIVGKIHTSQNLQVGEGAQITADLEAENATIAGQITGNITVKNSLTITETGKVTGNISCAHLAIHSGGFFSGQCQMHAQPNENILESNG